MAENSSIAWTDHTWNPWIGCSKVEDSPACRWCYAWWMDVQRFSKTLGGGTKENPILHWGPGAPRYRTSESAWKAPYKWNNRAICDDCGQHQTICATAGNLGLCQLCGADKMRNPRVFSLSLGDWLDEEVQIGWLADMLRVIHDCQNLTWLLLTKRPENWKSQLARALTISLTHGYASDERYSVAKWVESWLNGSPPKNVHIGITAEDQFNYDRRLPHFLKIPAVSRFLSIEPMCGKIDLSLNGIVTSTTKYHQVIVGGESGDHWKDNILNLDHMRDVFDQCRLYHVKRFAKQDSARLPGQRGRIPDDLWVQEFPV